MAEAHVQPDAVPVEGQTLEMPGVDNTTFGVWVWLAAESLFFASLIATFFILHNQLNGGPGPKTIFDLKLTLGATVTLLLSSLTMALAYSAVGQGALGRFRAWLVVTAVLGLLFAGAQAYEFHHYYHIGVTMESSPFGSAFFTLVGFHGMHVIFGVFWLISVLIFSYQPVFREEATTKVRALGLYWHFVDVVWVVIFTFVYLMGKVG